MSQPTESGSRNFSTISSSAKWVLLMKGYTDIPYARQTAELIQHPESFLPDPNEKDMNYLGRALHFESRYKSIDGLLKDVSITNILELSGGYSFRGLDWVQKNYGYYIDSDLPDMIARKKELISTLETDPSKRKGTLELLPLNAVEEKQFREVVSHFPAGPVVIVNEGLLMYLDVSEKERLCANIRSVLQERGGYWITADIYLKLSTVKIDLHLDEHTQKFFEEHNVEKNRFESFKAAEDFFNAMGFVIDKELDVNPYTLSLFPHVMSKVTPEMVQRMNKVGRISTTWRLRLADY